MMRFVVIIVLVITLCITTARVTEPALRSYANYDSGGQEIEVYHPRSNEETLIEFTRVLQPTNDDEMFFDPILADRIGNGSHLRIQYQSKIPAPVEIVPYPGGAPDVLFAVLPPSENGDVLLPIYKSSAWGGDTKGALIKVYGLSSVPPSILRLGTIDKFSPITGFIKSFRHPFVSEGFSYYVMSELAGYRFRGTSVALILGIILSMLVLALMFLGRSEEKFRRIVILCLSFILIYQARFLVDLTGYTMRLEKSWWSDHQLGHMGDIYQISSKVQDVIGEDNESDSFLLCTNMIATPLRHLLYPIIVEEPIKLKGPIPKYAVVTNVWNESASSFQCENLSFDGIVIYLFSDGKALVRITNNSS